MAARPVMPESPLTRDASKRKRVNRNAKLKQFKLDARREQWLSQGKQGVSNGDLSPNSVIPTKGNEPCEQTGSGESDAESCVINQDDLFDGDKGICNSNAVSNSICCLKGETPTEYVPGSSPVQQPVVFNPKKGEKGGKRRVKKVERLVEDADDWEAAADALDCQMTLKESSSAPKLEHIPAEKPERTKSENIPVPKPRMAWKPDDIFRPASLPKLKQPAWGSNSYDVPTSCPICAEELDSTDSSFLPCSCGFRMCLFCYHRISADDGRCPGCRKAYNSGVGLRACATTT